MTSHAGGAHDRIRTGDLVLTKDTLYRLSYVGAYATRIIGAPPPAFKPAGRAAAEDSPGVRRRGRTTLQPEGGTTLEAALFILLAVVLVWILLKP